ncbi:MAG: hypothetical protein ACT4NV_14020 [Rhodoferax sp.]
MPTPPVEPERRVNPELRARFEAVFVFLQPYFASQESWGGMSHEHLAYRALKERFPELSAQECFIAITAAKRLHDSSQRPR